jgi:DNA-binding NarL/FixJ family response regulator
MIRVVLADDQVLVRAGFKALLDAQADIEVVGEADDGRAAVRLAEELAPDIVLMDIRMPGMDGLEATRMILQDEQLDRSRIVILTTFDVDDHVFGALQAGADGFLLKDTPPAQILDAIRSVAAGNPMLSPSVTRTLIDKVRTDPAADRTTVARQRLQALTERELEVALAVGRGMSNAEIASELYLSVPTVKAHVSRLFEKLQVTNRVQIAICVHDAGLV